MRFRSGGFQEHKPTVVLDLTPLIDCIFQLLIFFLLTASFITTPNLGVELPKASAKASTTQQRDLIVVVTRKGEIQYEGKTMSQAALMQSLKQVHKERPNARVLIQADRKAYHGNVVKVMDTAKSVGFRRLGVAIQSRSR
ncbi:biopolymer transporter ExbD [bacterium]|nr:biopolymer transporter ExbD [bacterium]